MKLHEYQGKEILRQFGVNVQEGKVAYTPTEVRNIAIEYAQPVVVKAQVHVGGRGKAGGVKFSPTPDKAYENGQNILGMDIKGLTVNKVLVTKAVDIDAGTEYYVGMIVDRNVQSYTLMASAEGGMEIEEVAAAPKPTSSTTRSSWWARTPTSRPSSSTSSAASPAPTRSPKA